MLSPVGTETLDCSRPVSHDSTTHRRMRNNNHKAFAAVSFTYLGVRAFHRLAVAAMLLIPALLLCTRRSTAAVLVNSTVLFESKANNTFLKSTQNTQQSVPSYREETIFSFPCHFSKEKNQPQPSLPVPRGYLYQLCAAGLRYKQQQYLHYDTNLRI